MTAGQARTPGLVESVRLERVLSDVRTGFASGANLPDGVLQVRMNNVAESGVLDFTKERRVPVDPERLQDLRARPGDIMFNATNAPGLVGKSAIFRGMDEPVVFSNHFLRLRCASALEPAYLSHWLRWHFSRGTFRGMTRQWVNQASINRDQLMAMEIPLPPLAEQRRIAAILDHADSLRNKRRWALDRLDTLPQSIFIDMFGDPFTNPMAHSVVRLPELGSIDRGVSKHRPRNAPELLGGRWPLIQTGDVARSSGYLDKWTATYSDLGLAQSRLWPPGTLCITIAANIARTAEINFAACFPDSIVGFSCEDASIARFVRVWFTFMQSRLEQAAPESAQKNINLATLRSLRLPLPNKAARQKFLQATEHLRILGQGLLDSQEELDVLRAAVEQRAFSGNL